MKKAHQFILLFIICIAGSCNINNNHKEEIIVDLQKKGAPISKSMYGVFFEEINHAGDGGLYAELVKNRSFEELEMPEGYHAEGDVLYPKQVHNHITGDIRPEKYRWTTEPVPGWSLKVKDSLSAIMKLTKDKPKFSTAPNNLKVEIKDGAQLTRLVNEGYWGMGFKEGDKYLLRTIIRPSSDYKGNITVHLLSEEDDILASAILDISKQNEWNDLKVTLTPSATNAKGKLAIEFDASGTVYLDYVSLFPENTFNNRTNGLRKDAAEMLIGLQPSFVRWPGGCVVEGITLDNRFEWKKTLGDPASRSGEYSTWGYRCSYGFGYYEMLQFCEDINADAMFVCNVGLGCQFRMADASPDSEIAYYLNDCLDAIEYALGDMTTKWGAKRAEAGHPEPFPLKYVEIGNENWGDEYDKRFDIFYKSIKEKYPNLVLISNHGITGTGKIEKTDMVDPHWYVAPNFFFQNTHIFDDHPRGNYTVYVGEYACNNGVGSGNMLAALSEAAFISGMERNGDLVTMTSYAPLFENRNDRAWAVNLIWLDTEQVLGRSSYYVQKMAAENRPSYNIGCNRTTSDAKTVQYAKGTFGFGSWETQVEYKDIKVTPNGKEVELKIDQSADIRGTWIAEPDILRQTSEESATRYVIDGFEGENYTIECKARKIGGKEGFLIYLALNDDLKKGFMYNIGGWNNSITVVEEVRDGRNAGASGKSISQKIDTNRWYDVKLIVSPTKSELYMDGQLILSHEPMSTPLQFISSGYDEDAKEIILKITNADTKPYSTTVKLQGTAEVAKQGKVISLTAQHAEDENSFEEPKKIYPKESVSNGFGEQFDYDFPPLSYTVLRVKVK